MLQANPVTVTVTVTTPNIHHSWKHNVCTFPECLAKAPATQQCLRPWKRVCILKGFVWHGSDKCSGLCLACSWPFSVWTARPWGPPRVNGMSHAALHGHLWVCFVWALVQKRPCTRTRRSRGHAFRRCAHISVNLCVNSWAPQNGCTQGHCPRGRLQPLNGRNNWQQRPPTRVTRP